MGVGHNSLEWLSVRDGRNAQANIDTGLQALDPGTTYVRDCPRELVRLASR